MSVRARILSRAARVMRAVAARRIANDAPAAVVCASVVCVCGVVVDDEYARHAHYARAKARSMRSARARYAHTAQFIMFM